MRFACLRTTVIFLFALEAGLAGEASWLDRVAPIITSAEKKTYLTLDSANRAKFEDEFFARRALTAQEYFERLAYVDSTFGSGKAGSGANTDQGAVYLAIGAATKVSRHASSRIFVPMEIWYYDSVPGLLNTELRLIFFQKNDIGPFKLYSPNVDTIRALLLPEASTVHMFGPNDSVTETDVRNNLRVPPGEDEVITAAANVATGIKYFGNDEIIGLVSSPREMLLRPVREQVTSRLIVAAAKMDALQTPAEYGGTQVDLQFDCSAAHLLELEVIEGALPVYHDQLRLNFEKARRLEYLHRLDLLPGSYRMVLTADGKPTTFPLEIGTAAAMSDIRRADVSDASGRRDTPFHFGDRRLDPNPDGKFAAILLSQPEKVTWRIRKGSAVVWRSVSDPGRLATLSLADAHLPPGTYMVEAVTENDARSSQLILREESKTVSDATEISYNANLAQAMRYALVGHEWLLRGDLDQARRSLKASLDKGSTDDAQIELARLDALAGNLDAARDRVRPVLARKPDQFEALSVLAYVEAGLQDYKVASDLYRRALAIQDSPALRAALAKLPLQ